MTAQTDAQLVIDKLLEMEEDDYEFTITAKDLKALDKYLPIVDQYVDIRRMVKTFKEKSPGEFELVAKSFEAVLAEIKALLNCRGTEEAEKKGSYRSGKNLSLTLRLLLSKFELKREVIKAITKAKSAEELTVDLPNFSVNALKNLYDLYGSSRHKTNVKFLLNILHVFSVCTSVKKVEQVD